MFYLYILRCADHSYSTGQTDNLPKRVEDHQTGSIPGYTATRRPVRLVHASPFLTREEAVRAERQVKGWSRAKKEALIRGDLASLPRLARRRHH